MTIHLTINKCFSKKCSEKRSIRVKNAKNCCLRTKRVLQKNRDEKIYLSIEIIENSIQVANSVRVVNGIFDKKKRK